METHLKFMLAGLCMCLLSTAVIAAPYDNLSTALRQQLIINDLRTHCRIPQQINDEQIRSTFLASSENHQTVLAAADALRMNNREQYLQQLDRVRCPEMP